MAPLLANLRDDVAWRRFLALLFALAAGIRLLVLAEVRDHPAWRPEERRDTEAGFYWAIARDMAAQGNLLAKGTHLPLTREMVAAAPAAEWAAWMQGRLPRGGVVLQILAISFGLGGGVGLYLLASTLAGAAIAPVCAAAAARCFRCRSAGAAAGLLAASHQSLIAASLQTGPWTWEALLSACAILALVRIRDDSANPAEWMLAGLIAAVGIWFRPFFFWAIAAAPLACVSWRLRPARATLAALILLIAVSSGALALRNREARGAPVPLVGFPAWEFLQNTNALALLGPSQPPDLLALQAANGSFLRVVQLTAGSAEWRAAAPRVLTRKLREFLGARDVAAGTSFDYMRRRCEILRLTAIKPDVSMAAAWAALLFLLIRRRLPPLLFAAPALLAAHGLLFSTAGLDRLPLHAIACLLIGGALAESARHFARPSVPFLYLTLWAAFHYALQIDDHARGTRFRTADFLHAARTLRNAGNPDAARIELNDLERLRRIETVLGAYWYRKN